MAVTKEIAQRQMAEADHRPNPSRASQVLAGQRAIMREYGSVIGENQARNIAYHVLVAARGVTFEAE